MTKNKNVDLCCFGFGCLFSIPFFIGYFIENSGIMIFSLCLLLLVLLCKIFINKNFLCFLFLCIFVFFQMTRLILDFLNLSDLKWYRGYVGDYFDISVQKHILLCFYLVLQGLLLSLYTKVKNKNISLNSRYFLNDRLNIQISLVLSIFFLIPAVVQNLLAVKFVLTNGYFAYYKSFSPPYILSVFSGMSYVFIYIYMSISHKLSKVFLFFYIINFITSLLIGSRKDFVLYLLLMVFYFWNTRNNFSFKMIKKFFLPVVLLFSLLFFWGFAREGAISTISKYKINPLVLFLDTQGTSVVVPGYSKLYEDEIPNKGIAYLFPNQIRMVTNLLGTTIDKSDRKRDALEGFYISKFISYKVLGDRFVVGEGLGGSFITDIYYCFSYGGVFFFSFLVGIFMKYCEKSRKNNLRYVIILSCVYNLLYIPRSQAFDIIIQITSIKFWVAILFYVFINELLRSIKRRNLNENCNNNYLLSK